MADNGILTAGEVERFISAVSEIRSTDIEASDVIDARGTAADFIGRYGQPDESDESGGLTVHHWNTVQAAKGQPRKSLTLAEFGGERVAVTHMA
jgi:hypothetical protein